MNSESPVIFIWCADCLHVRRVTGIPQVIRNLVRYAQDIGAEAGFAAYPVVLQDDKLVQVAAHAVYAPQPAIEADSPGQRSPERGSIWHNMGRTQAARRVRWYSSKLRAVLCHLLMSKLQAEHSFWAALLMSGDYPGAWHARILWRRLTRRPPLQHPFERWISAKADMRGNILVIAGISWRPRDWYCFRQFQARGGKVVTIQYDLFPILQPDTSFTPLEQQIFTAWVQAQVARSDAIIAISQTIAAELRGYLEAQVPRRAATVRIGHFHLGSDFEPQRESAALPPDVQAMFDPAQHVFLMVGSIARRKNQHFVLEAFDQYWAKGGTAKLLIVGHVTGRGAEDIAQRLQTHAKNGILLHHLTNINDAELETIYRQAAALIMASSSEGFGLPLVEAMQRGVPVLCSDIPIFHEVTGERAEFFSLAVPDALAALLSDFETRHKPGQPIPRAPVKCLSWRESTELMLTTMFRLLETD